MKIAAIVMAATALTATSAAACSAIKGDAERLACYDAAHKEVSLIRCTDFGSGAKCDLLTPGPNDLLSCIAYDASGSPIARESAFGGVGLVLRDISASEIDHVDCSPVG